MVLPDATPDAKDVPEQWQPDGGRPARPVSVNRLRSYSDGSSRILAKD